MSKTKGVDFQGKQTLVFRRDANIYEIGIVDSNFVLYKNGAVSLNLGTLDSSVTTNTAGILTLNTAPKIGSVQATIGVADMTDSGVTGTYEFTDLIPAGAVVMQSTISGLTGFAGDTSATVTIGDGSTADRYNTGTPNVFATAAHISAGAAENVPIWDLIPHGQTPTALTKALPIIEIPTLAATGKFK